MTWDSNCAIIRYSKCVTCTAEGEADEPQDPLQARGPHRSHAVAQPGSVRAGPLPAPLHLGGLMALIGTYTQLVRIPRRFFDDHQSRDLETPAVIHATKTHYVIDRNDPAVPELISDARFYADPIGGPSGYDGERGLRAAARSLLKSLEG